MRFLKLVGQFCLQHYTCSVISIMLAFDKHTLLLLSRNGKLLITVRKLQNAFELTVMKAKQRRMTGRRL